MYIDQLPTLNKSIVKKGCGYIKFSFSDEVGIQGEMYSTWLLTAGLRQTFSF